MIYPYVTNRPTHQPSHSSDQVSLPFKKLATTPMASWVMTLCDEPLESSWLCGYVASFQKLASVLWSILIIFVEPCLPFFAQSTSDRRSTWLCKPMRLTLHNFLSFLLFPVLPEHEVKRDVCNMMNVRTIKEAAKCSPSVKSEEERHRHIARGQGSSKKEKRQPLDLAMREAAPSPHASTAGNCCTTRHFRLLYRRHFSFRVGGWHPRSK